MKTNQNAKINPEISKGEFGKIYSYPNEACFIIYNKIIKKRPKLKEEVDNILKLSKTNSKDKINNGILKIKSISDDINIKTEPIIDNLANIKKKYITFKIYIMFEKFNIFLRECFEKGIDLSDLQLSDIFLTAKEKLKLLSIKYNSEILRKMRTEKNQKNMVKLEPKNKEKEINLNKRGIKNIGEILYFLYYNTKPDVIDQNKEYSPCKLFSDLIKKCLASNINDRLTFEEYLSHPFFQMKITIPEVDKNKIIPINKYKRFTDFEKELNNIDELKCLVKDNKIYLYFNNNIILEREKQSKYTKIINLKNKNNKNIFLVAMNSSILVLKKIENTFSVTQEIKTYIEAFFITIIEFDNGQIGLNDEINLNIYSKTHEDQFQSVLKLDIPIYNLYLYKDYLGTYYNNETIYYDTKNGFKIYQKFNGQHEIINDKINFIYSYNFSIYHKEFNEIIGVLDADIYVSTKLPDGSFLLGGYRNDIYQITLDKYGLPEIICIIDNGFGIWKDPDDDCIYSLEPDRPYGTKEFILLDNGNIIVFAYKEMKGMVLKLK